MFQVVFVVHTHSLCVLRSSISCMHSFFVGQAKEKIGVIYGEGASEVGPGVFWEFFKLRYKIV